MEISMLVKLIEDFLETIPQTLDVLGYGSKVKEQNNYEPSSKANIDIIATVEDDIDWHILNKLFNPEQYSLFARISNFPTSCKTSVSYLANIVHNDNIFKIGVIKKQELLDNLKKWNDFYLPGRLLKSILEIKTDKVLKEAIKLNRINALKIALILNYGKEITEYDLLYTICNLSFKDDIRMRYKMENPHKVENIVKGSYEELSKIYNELNEDLFTLSNGIVIPNYQFIIDNINELPESLFLYLIENCQSLNDLEKLKDMINIFLRKKVRIASTVQPIKSILLNPISKSTNYAFQKHLKYKEK